MNAWHLPFVDTNKIPGRSLQVISLGVFMALIMETGLSIGKGISSPDGVVGEPPRGQSPSKPACRY